MSGSGNSEKHESERDRDAVDAKRDKGVRAHKCEQEFDAEQGDEKRGNETRGENTKLLRREGGGILEKVVASGCQHRRHGEKERKLHDRATT